MIHLLPQALGDLVESCVGAILLDTGFNLNLVWKIMLSFLDPIMRFSSFQLSPIRELQELCQSYNLDLKTVPSKKGRMFSVEVQVNREDVCVTASATNLNKKDAIRVASQRIFAKLKVNPYAYFMLFLSCCLNFVKLSFFHFLLDFNSVRTEYQL